MRVDITGVSGFIGAAVTAYLASLEGVEVIALTRTIPSIPLLDRSRAAQKPGWEPQVPLAERIRRMWVEATGS